MYWEDDTKPETMGKVRVSANQNTVNISGLKGYTQYFLTVSSFNTAGTGPHTPTINITTKKSREYSPQSYSYFCCIVTSNLTFFLYDYFGMTLHRNTLHYLKLHNYKQI